MFQESENTWNLENYPTTLSNDIVEDRNDTYDKLKAILPSIIPKVELPEGIVTQKINISKIVDKDIPVPVVAVLDPSKETNKRIESSIVALLPNVNPTDSDDQLNYLNTNCEKIRRDVQRYIDESSLSVASKIWKRSVGSEAEVKSVND